jgi:hypothetical protein
MTRKRFYDIDTTMVLKVATKQISAREKWPKQKKMNDYGTLKIKQCQF